MPSFPESGNHGISAPAVTGNRSEPADHAAGDFLSRVPGGLGGKVIRIPMDNDGSADDFIHGESVRQENSQSGAVISPEGRQIPGVTGVGAGKLCGGGLYSASIPASFINFLSDRIPWVMYFPS